MSGDARRSSAESSPRIEYVQLDGLVAMKISKHCHEEAGGVADFAQGILLGMVDNRCVEVTNCFPCPRHGDEEEYDEQEYQMEVLRQMRTVNLDHMIVGFYQSAPFGSFFTRPLFESQFSYQDNIEESILLVYDPIKAQKGFLSLRAFRLTEAAFKLCREGEYTLDSFKNNKCSYSELFEEIPVQIRNSHLMNLLQCELSEMVPSHVGKQFLDMSTAFSLERQLQATMECVDTLNQETNKMLNYQRQVQRHSQQKQVALAKRAQENQNRKQRDEPPLPEDDIHKLFKTIPMPPRLDSVLLAGQVESHCDQLSRFSTQNLAKLFMSNALQKKE